jgi:hypothetical protein
MRNFKLEKGDVDYTLYIYDLITQKKLHYAAKLSTR